jgi:hypothetical protein
LFTTPRGLSLAGLKVCLLLSYFWLTFALEYSCRIVVLHINTPVSGLVKGQGIMARFPFFLFVCFLSPDC